MARNSYAAFYLRNFCQCLIFWRTRTSTVPVWFFVCLFFCMRSVFHLSFHSSWNDGVLKVSVAKIPTSMNECQNSTIIKFKGTAVSKVANMSPRSILFYSGPADTCSHWLVEFADPLWVLIFSSSVQQLFFFLCVRCTKKSAAYLSLNYLVGDKSK